MDTNDKKERRWFATGETPEDAVTTICKEVLCAIGEATPGPAGEYYTWRKAPGAGRGRHLGDSDMNAINLFPARPRARTRKAQDKAACLGRERKIRESWLQGGAVRFRGRDSQGGVYLRAVGVERNESGDITGGILETNQGVYVPLTDALRVFRFVKHCRKIGTPWHISESNNWRTIWVGSYGVESVDSDGSLNVGCHRINWPQMESLALRLGVAND